MLISDKLKTFDFTDSEKEIVKYFLNQKEEIENKSTRENESHSQLARLLCLEKFFSTRYIKCCNSND